MKLRNLELVQSANFGVCIGDAVGLPVQFKSRADVKLNPVTDMIGYGAFNMPKGSWSDDGSLTLCLAESLCRGYDYNDIVNNFIKWYRDGYLTPLGKSYDVGSTTQTTMKNILSGISPREAGGRAMENNGNGSLMRILPLLFYIDAFVKDENKKFDLIEEVSSITHGHIIAIVCCYIYIDFNIMLLSGLNFKDAYAAIQSQKSKYKNHLSSEEYKYFERILEGDLNLLIEDEIKSDGFVIHTFEASLWCLLKSNSYKETILRAVNLGLDTDTVAAIAGGSAGIYYGFNTIPQNWIDDLIKKEEVFSISSALFKHCYNK